jgi:hypothetical protein
MNEPVDPNSPDDRRKYDLAIVDQAIKLLGEHFDTVHVFVTRHEPAQEGGTINIHKGTGNWFARYGQITEWAIKEEEDSRLNVRKRNDNEK